MKRSKSSSSGFSDQSRRPPSSPSVAGASQDVTWKYKDSPVRDKVQKQNSEQNQFVNTPVRIMKRHASSPLPDHSSKALQHSRQLKTLVEFEKLPDDDDSSFNFSDFDITEEELAKICEETDKNGKHERLLDLTSTALPRSTHPLRPRRQLTQDLPQTQLSPPKSIESEPPDDLDNSYDNAVLGSLCSIPMELLSGQKDIKFDPELKLSQIVPIQTASTLKAAPSSGEKKFFKHRSNPIHNTAPQEIPLSQTQKLRK